MKSPSTVQTFDEYIKNFPPEVRQILSKIRQVIQEEAPEATEAIVYGIPTFRLNGNLVHFGAYEHHIGFYPTPQAIEDFASELAKYKRAKGSVQFPLDQPIPYDLIGRITKDRVAKQMAKKA